MTTWKNLVIQVLAEKGELSITEIMSEVSKMRAPNGKHFDANIRGILNRGVKNGLFIRTGKGKYRLGDSIRVEKKPEVKPESKTENNNSILDAMKEFSEVISE